MNNVDRLRSAFKSSASALKSAGLSFALGGSYALWVHGAPEPTHDVGFDVERPPEDWIVKAHADGAVVDVLHRLNGVPVDSAWLDRAVVQDVLGLRVPVQPASDVMLVKLRALTEHYCDFGALLPAARAVREQLDWDRLRAETADNDFAAVFLILADRLGLTR
jgi:hypothetical protein